jgi:hypothetical protein
MLLEASLKHGSFQAVLVCNLTGYVEELAVAATWLFAICEKPLI